MTMARRRSVPYRRSRADFTTEAEYQAYNRKSDATYKRQKKWFQNLSVEKKQERSLKQGPNKLKSYHKNKNPSTSMRIAASKMLR